MWTATYFNMGKPRKGIWLFLLFVGITTSLKAVSGNTLYLQLGETLVLTPKTPPESGHSITWYLGSQKVIEYDPSFSDMAQAYGRFNDRTTLSKTTGELQMTDLTKEDAGDYTLEVKSNLKEKYTVAVFRAISATPIISLSPKSCDIHHPPCRLTCELPDTTDAEPLTYSWKAGDEPWKDSPDNHLIINDTAAGATFICKIKNPVSENDSEPFIIPIGTGSSNTVVLAVLIPLLLIIIVVLGVLSQLIPGLKRRRGRLLSYFVNCCRCTKTDAASDRPPPANSVPLMNHNDTEGVPVTVNTASSPLPADAASPDAASDRPPPANSVPLMNHNDTEGVPVTVNTASSPLPADAASPGENRNGDGNESVENGKLED